MSVELVHRFSGRDGAPVLMLGNSLGTTGELWRPQLAAFEEHFRVLRYEHRGHGGSPAPPGPYTLDDLGGDVLALLDRLAVDRVSYCGVSLGGMVGMWLAAHAPGRVDRLALCCTSARFDSPDPWRDRAARVRRDGTGSVASQVVPRWFTPPFVAARPAVVHRFEDTLATCDAAGYAGCCDAIAAMDLRPVLPAVTAPTTVIAGAVDPATPPEHGRRIADAVAGARLHVLADAAHLANVERPAEVTAIMMEHLVGKGDPGNVL
jgi:3-oxoadipate enol-lactonase